MRSFKFPGSYVVIAAIAIMVITSGDTTSINPISFPTTTTTTGTAPILTTVISVAVVGTIIIIVVATITVAIFFYIRSKHSNVLNVQGSVGDGGGDSTLEKTLDIELTGLKRDKEGIVIHKGMKYRGSGLESKGGGVYETVTDIIPSQYETVGGGEGSEVKSYTTYSTVDDCIDETYKSRHSEKRKEYQLQGDCSRYESLAGNSEVTQPNKCSPADNPIYSDPDVANKQTFTSLPGVSLQPKVSAVPQEIQDSEYAVIGTTGAPEIPKKSDILVDYLETNSFNVQAEKKLEVSVSEVRNCGDESEGDGDSCSNMDVYSDPDKHLSQ